MRALIAQWWHSRVLKHDQRSECWYYWGDPESYPRRIDVWCACGAAWSHSA